MSDLVRQLLEQAQRAEKAVVLREETQSWTGAAFADKVRRAANGFLKWGVQPQDRVGVMLSNHKEFFVAFLALRCIGAVVVPINLQMLPQDIAYVVQHAGVRRLVIHQTLLEKTPTLAPLPCAIVSEECVGQLAAHHCWFESLYEQEPLSLSPPKTQEPSNSMDFLIYTSGTSGHPKGVMLSEFNLLSNIEGFLQVVRFTQTDRVVLALPLFHAYGLIIGLAALKQGAALTLIPNFHPKAIVHAMVEEQATILPLVPSLFSTLLKLISRAQPPLAFPALRFCVSGGASLPGALLSAIEQQLGAPVIEGYGMTESSPVISVNDPEVGSIPHAVGKPLPNVNVQITDSTGASCMPGQEGEIWVKGPNVMAGYYQDPEATALTLSPQGWLKTGDLGRFDEAGVLYITGRIKDLIIKAGENIAPRSIEEVLYQHPAVGEAAVVGQPDERYGECLVACVSPKEDQSIDPSQLLGWCRQHLTPSYVPDEVRIFESLPKNATGKILKKVLKQALADPSATDAVGAVT